MDCFIKKIWQGNGECVHNYFIRFGKGKFDGRAVLFLQKASNVKLRGSFEWATDFANLVAELVPANFSGVLLSKQNIPELGSGKPKSGIFQYDILADSQKILGLKDKAYCMMLDAEGPGISLKMKKKLPKPGKSGEAKVDDKFCVLEADIKYWQMIKEAFMLPECRKARISHTYIIEEIILPQGETDFAKMRELAKRKGKILRKMEIDGNISSEEKSFEA